jgi:hypothetical protein
MHEIRLLILDDDSEVVESFQSVIKRINRDDKNTFRYKAYVAANLEEAKGIIKYNRLDTAVIDLNLNNSKQTDPDNDDGNKAIEELMQNFRMPIFVVSGEPEKLYEAFQKHPLIKCYARDQFDNGLEKTIPELFFSESIHYFARDGLLEQMINRFYWEHLSQTIKSWEEVEKEHSVDIKKILSRHTLSCLNEELYVNGNIGSFDKYHPGEMYIIPPIKQHYHTGDIIIKKDGEKFIILNPACDIVNDINLDYYILVKVTCFTTLTSLLDKIKKDKPYEYFYESLNKKGKSCYDDCRSNKKDRFHYLPQFGMMSNNVIDFQNITMIPKDEISSFERIASISSLFLKDIIARFSAYYARQGQPNFL